MALDFGLFLLFTTLIGFPVAYAGIYIYRAYLELFGFIIGFGIGVLFFIQLIFMNAGSFIEGLFLAVNMAQDPGSLATILIIGTVTGFVGGRLILTMEQLMVAAAGFAAGMLTVVALTSNIGFLAIIGGLLGAGVSWMAYVGAIIISTAAGGGFLLSLTFAASGAGLLEGFLFIFGTGVMVQSGLVFFADSSTSDIRQSGAYGSGSSDARSTGGSVSEKVNCDDCGARNREENNICYYCDAPL